jgi:hypothetical protein
MSVELQPPARTGSLATWRRGNVVLQTIASEDTDELYRTLEMVALTRARAIRGAVDARMRLVENLAGGR